MKKEFEVAGIRFCLESGEPLRLEQYAPFAVEGEGQCVFRTRLEDSLSYGELTTVLDQPTEPGETKITLFRCEEGWLVRMYPTSRRPLSAELLLSEDYTLGRLHILVESDALFAVNNALMLQYAFTSAAFGVLEMHASVTVNAGKAYLFLAKSGTGKSTHSSLWLKHIPGSHLMNDDNPVVRVFDDGRVIAYGSPWSGKTPCYRNESFPVGAFVKISRAPHNRLVRQGVVEAYATIYSSVSGFKADPKMANDLHNNVTRAIAGARCFVMECLPDEQAARVCHEGVTNDDK